MYNFDAKIRIRDFFLKTGDTENREKIMDIKWPEFVEREGHKLVLCQFSGSDKLEIKTWSLVTSQKIWSQMMMMIMNLLTKRIGYESLMRKR